MEAEPQDIVFVVCKGTEPLIELKANATLWNTYSFSSVIRGDLYEAAKGFWEAVRERAERDGFTFKLNAERDQAKEDADGKYSNT